MAEQNYPLVPADAGRQISDSIREAIQGLKGSLFQQVVQASMAQIAVKAGQVQLNLPEQPGKDPSQGSSKPKQDDFSIFQTLPRDLQQFLGGLRDVFAPLAGSLKHAGGFLQTGPAASAIGLLTGSAGGPAAAAGGAAGKVAGAVGAAALSATPAGMAVEATMAVASVVSALATLPFTIKDFTKSLLEANRDLANVSASMAMVMAQNDVRGILRDMKKGEMLAGDAQKLSNAWNDLADRTMQLEVGFEKLKLRIGELLATFANKAIDYVKTKSEDQGWGEKLFYRAFPQLAIIKDLLGMSVEKLEEIAKNTENDDLGDAISMGEWMQGVADDAAKKLGLDRIQNDVGARMGGAVGGGAAQAAGQL